MIRRRASVRGRAGTAGSVRGCPPPSRAPAASHATAPTSPPWTGEPPQPLPATTTDRPTAACPLGRPPAPPDPSTTTTSPSPTAWDLATCTPRRHTLTDDHA